MKALARTAALLPWLADRANPLLVRYVRQELRNRTFLVVFNILLLFAGVASMLVATIAIGEQDAGADLLAVLCGVLGFALWVIQPMGVYMSMIRERDENTWDLLDLTGMRPGRLLRGYLLAGLVQGMLYFSAVAPFLVMAYLLKGIDLLSILMALVLLAAGGIALSCFAVFLGTVQTNKSGRGGLNLILLLCVLGVWSLGWPLWLEGLEEVSRGLARGFAVEPWGVIAALGFMTNLWLAAVVVLLSLSAAQLTFRADNRSTMPRLVWMLVWCNGLAWCIGLIALADMRAREVTQMFAVYAVFGTVWGLLLAAFACTEDYPLSPRQARWIREARGWRKATAWFLGPGAARGTLAALLLLAASLGVGAVAIFFRTDDDWSELMLSAWLMIAYGMTILVSVDRLCRGPFSGWIQTPGMRRSALLPTIIALALITSIPALAFEDSFGVLNAFNPLIAPVYLPDDGLAVGIDAFTADVAIVLISFAGCFAIFAQLVFAFAHMTIKTTRVRADADIDNPRES
ncbi:MAG: hypothetical protein ACOCYN_00330 [Planctomycetota bacterium]